jgi:hypothetical protein
MAENRRLQVVLFVKTKEYKMLQKWGKRIDQAKSVNHDADSR